MKKETLHIRLKANLRKSLTNIKTWVLLTMLILLGVVAPQEAKAAGQSFIVGEYIYIKNFVPSGWGSTTWILSNSYAYAHMWGGTGGTIDILFELCSGTAGAKDAVYRAQITKTGTYTNIIFTRNSAKGGPWSNKWNQTGDIVLSTGSTINRYYGFTDKGIGKSSDSYNPSPTITTSAASSITATSATVGGQVNNTENVKEMGIEWTQGKSGKTTTTTSTSAFTKNITGLTESTTYKYKTYVTFYTGTTKYGSEQSFTTPSACPTSVTPGTASGTTSICSGGSAEVILTGNTDGSTIQWQQSTDNSNFTDISGATSASYSASNLTQTTYFRAKVTLEEDDCDAVSDESNVVTVTVNDPIAPALGSPTKTICSASTTASLSTLSNANGTVNWYDDNRDLVDNGTISIATDGIYYFYGKSVVNGCESSKETKFTLTITATPDKPTISANKAITNGNISLVGDESVTLSVQAVDGFTYTWYRGSNNIVHTGATYTTNVEGTYTVIAKNGDCTSAASDAVTVSVCTPISELNWSITDGEKTTYCPGDEVEVTMTYNGNDAEIFEATKSDGIVWNITQIASGVVYTMTINNTGSVKMNLTDCDGNTATTLPLTFNVMEAPATPTVKVVNNIIKCGNDFTQYGKIQITNYNPNYSYKIGVNNDPLDPSAIDANGNISGLTLADKFTLYAINSCGVATPSAQFEITETNNKPTITGNNSFQPGGSTTLTSDKGESTTWEALDGGDITSSTTGTSIVFTAEENGIYRVQATYNGCSTIVEIKVQDDLYVWVRRPIKKETAYDQFYHEDQNSEQGGDLFYKEFASLPSDYQQYNQGGKAADKTCTDKDGYTWYGFIVSKTAIENDHYFTVHAPNDGGEQGDAAKYNGYYTHTYATQLVDMDADLYFVMDETPSNVSRGWNINTPVVVRASGDASFNGNNFADFVPLYAKDANICGKEVVSFEWQKSDSQNGTYTTYKSGEGINNIRTREAGWYRCVVTYGDGKGTATSNAIQVTNAGGTNYSFTSKLPILMVNTNGVGFPNEPASGFPSVDAENLKAKVSVDVIIKKGDDIVYDRKARMNYRGSSSLNFKKKSYAFVSGQDSCVFDKSRHDYVKTKKAKMLNILGLDYAANDKDWVLYAATPDPSMMRNRLVFDLYQQMRPGEWGVHSTYVELIVDGEYQGVYVFMDKITANEGRVNITNSDGFIVKFDKTDVADRVEKDGDQKTFATTRTGTKNSSDGITSYDTKIDQRFEIEYPEKEDTEDAGGNWEAFYSKVQQRFEDFETALANKQYDKVRAIIDYDSWADWFILTEFIKNQDGFRASCLFVYDGDKIEARPLWDQELSMDNRTRMAHGSTDPDGLLSTTSSVYSDGFPAPFWFTNKGTDVNNLTGGLLNDPCFVALVKTKWAEYQAGILSASNCSTLVAKYHGELDDNIRSREVTKWPYTQAARGTTNSGKYMGYYNDTEGDPTHYSYNASKNAITNYASKRSTTLDSNSGLGKAINDLKGEALIFTIAPSTIETTPWEQVMFTVNAPEGYDYTLDLSALETVNAVIKENGDTYAVKIPRPEAWGVGGNGDADDSEEYTIEATIEVSGESECGTIQDGTANSTITLKDVVEDCETPIEKP